jgi:hypothetical protein
MAAVQAGFFGFLNNRQKMAKFRIFQQFGHLACGPVFLLILINLFCVIENALAFFRYVRHAFFLKIRFGYLSC